MHHLVLISLIVFAIAVAGGIGAVAVQGLALWRAFRRSQRMVTRRLAEVTTELHRLERRSGQAAETAARLDEARARLQASLSTAAILTGAANEALGLAGRIRGVVPRSKSL